MSAWTQLMEPGPALLFLVVISSPYLVQAAPFENEQSTEIEYYPVADATGCYYNFEHYDEGDRIITNEPCLNCTCHNRMLMCYLRVCPFTKAIGQNCKVEKKPDQCCPVITCPEVPVQLVPQSSTEPITALGHLNEYGCSIDNLFYADGAKVPSNPDNPCEVCYCIRNKTACIIQECTLTGKVVEGCRPVYLDGVCCPLRYDCDHPQIETTPKPLLTTTTTTTTTTTIAPTTLAPKQCIFKDELYADGALVKKDLPCEKCYCMRGDIICAVQECGPTPLDKVNCTALPIKPGQCCPDTYDCGDVSDEDLTTLSYNEAPTTLPTLVSSPAGEEGETVQASETPPPHSNLTEEKDFTTEAIISERGSLTTESVTEAITSRITEAVTGIVGAITSTIYGSTEKPAEIPEQHYEPETGSPEIITESGKEAETLPPMAHHTEPQTDEHEVTTNEISEGEGEEPIVHDDHEEPEDNEIPDVHEETEGTTVTAQEGVHIKPEDNEIDQHYETVKPIEITTPEQKEEYTKSPEVITEASIAEIKPTEIHGEESGATVEQEPSSDELEQTEVPSEEHITTSQEAEVTPEFVIPTTEQIEAGEKIPHSSTGPSYEASSKGTEASVIGDEEVTDEATKPSFEEPEILIRATEAPTEADKEPDTSKTPEITQTTVQPGQDREKSTPAPEIIEITKHDIQEPEEEIHTTALPTEPTGKDDSKHVEDKSTSGETQTEQISEEKVSSTTAETTGIEKEGVTESKPSSSVYGEVTETPEKEIKPIIDQDRITQSTSTEQSEEMEIVTGIPTKETERPQSMDHISETAVQTELPEIQKEGEPSHEEPTKEGDNNEIPAVVEECTKEGCTKLEHTPTSDVISEPCTKEGCTQEGQTDDETRKGEQPESTESSDIPEGVSHDCEDGEDCVPEDEHVPESTEPAEHGAEQEPTIPESTAPSVPIIEHEHEKPSTSLPEGQVTEETFEPITDVPKKESGEPESSIPEVATEHDLLVTKIESQDTESPASTDHPEITNPVLGETTSDTTSPEQPLRGVDAGESDISSEPGSTELPDIKPNEIEVESTGKPESESSPAYVMPTGDNITEHPDIQLEHVTPGAVESSGKAETTEYPGMGLEHSTEIDKSESTELSENKPEQVTSSEKSSESESTSLPESEPEHVTPGEGTLVPESTESPEGKPEHVTSQEQDSKGVPKSTESPENEPDHVTPSGESDEPESTDLPEIKPEDMKPSGGSVVHESTELPENEPEHVTSLEEVSSSESKATESPERKPEYVTTTEGSGVPGSTELPESKPEHITPSEGSGEPESTELPENKPEHTTPSEGSGEQGSTELPESKPEQGSNVPESTELPEEEPEHMTPIEGSGEPESPELPESEPEHITPSEGSGMQESTELPDIEPEHISPIEGSDVTKSTELPEDKPGHITPSEGSGQPESTELPVSDPEHITPSEGSGEQEFTELPESKPEYTSPSEGSDVSESTELPESKPEHISPSEGSDVPESTELPEEKPEHITPSEGSDVRESTELPEEKPEHISPSEGSGESEATELPESKPEQISPSEGGHVSEATELPESKPEQISPSEGGHVSESTELPEDKPEHISPSGGISEPEATELPENRPEHITPSEENGVPKFTDLPENKPEHVTTSEESNEPVSTELPEHVTHREVEIIGESEPTVIPKSKPEDVTSSEGSGMVDSAGIPESETESVTASQESNVPESTESTGLPENIPDHIPTQEIETTDESKSAESPESRPEHVTSSEGSGEPQSTELPETRPETTTSVEIKISGDDQGTTETQHTESELTEKPSAQPGIPEISTTVKQLEVEELTTTPSVSSTGQHTEIPEVTTGIPKTEQEITIKPSPEDEEHHEITTAVKTSEGSDTATEAPATPLSTLVSHIPEGTQAPEHIQPSSAPESEVSTTEEAERVVPGEGNCLVDGKTYANNSQVPPINQCQDSCKCVSSILQCESVPCPGPPSDMQDCMPLMQSPGSCCPTYICSGPGVTNAMESDSHVVEITTAAVEEESPVTHVPSVEVTSQEDHKETPVSEVIPTAQGEEITTHKTIPQEQTEIIPEKEEPLPQQTTVSPEVPEATDDAIPEHDDSGNVIPEEPTEETHITPEHCGEDGCEIPTNIEPHVIVTVEEPSPHTTSSSEEESPEKSTQQPSKEYPEVPEKDCGPEGCSPKEEPQVTQESCGSEGCAPAGEPESEGLTTISPKSSEKEHCGPEGCISEQQPVESVTILPPTDEEIQKTTQQPAKEYSEPTKHCGPEGCVDRSKISAEHCGPDGCASIEPQKSEESAQTTSPSTEREQELITDVPVIVPDDSETTKHGESSSEDTSVATVGSISLEQTESTEKTLIERNKPPLPEISVTEESVSQITAAEEQSPEKISDNVPAQEAQKESSTTTIPEHHTIPEHDTLPEEDKTKPSKESSPEQKPVTESAITESSTILSERSTNAPEVITEIIPETEEHSTETISGEHDYEKIPEGEVTEKISEDVTEKILEDKVTENILQDVTEKVSEEEVTEKAAEHEVTEKILEVSEIPVKPMDVDEQLTTLPETSSEHLEPTVEKTTERYVKPTVEQTSEIGEFTTAVPIEIITETEEITAKPIESAEHVTEQAQQEYSTLGSHEEKEPENITPEPHVKPTVSTKEQLEIQTTTTEQIPKYTEPASVSSTEEKVTESEIPEPEFPIHPSEISSPKSTEVIEDGATTKKEDVTISQQEVDEETTNFPTHPSEVSSPESTEVAENEEPTEKEEVTVSQQEVGQETTPGKHIPVDMNTGTQTEQVESTTQSRIPEVSQYVTESQLSTDQTPIEEHAPEGMDYDTTESQLGTKSSSETIPKDHTEESSSLTEEPITDLPQRVVTEEHTKLADVTTEKEQEHVTSGYSLPEEIDTEKVPSAEVSTQNHLDGDEVTETQHVTEEIGTESYKPQPTGVETDTGKGEYATEPPQPEISTETPEIATEAIQVEVITKGIPRAGEVVTEIPEALITEVQPIDEGVKTSTEPELEHGFRVTSTDDKVVTTEAQQLPGKETTEVPPSSTQDHPSGEITPESVNGHPEVGVTAPQGYPEEEVTQESGTSHPAVQSTESQAEEVEIPTEPHPGLDHGVSAPTESKPEGETSTRAQPGVITTATSPVATDEITTQIPIEVDRLKPEDEAATGPAEEMHTSPTQAPRNDSEPFTSGPAEVYPTSKTEEGGLSTSLPLSSTPQPKPVATEPSPEITAEHDDRIPELPDYPSPAEDDEEDSGPLGPGTCRYGGKVFVSAQQIPRDDPCDFCFCFRSDIICLQQSCPPPIPNCHEEPIRGFCCPRYECPVGMATALNVTTTTTTTTTTLPPHFLAHAYKGRARKTGCLIQGRAYKVGDFIGSASGPCMHCTCGGDGQMKCDPKQCSPEPMLRQMIAVASRRRR